MQSQESFGIAVVRVYQLWGCLNQQQSHPHRQTTEDIEVVYDIQHIIVVLSVKQHSDEKSTVRLFHRHLITVLPVFTAKGTVFF